MLKKKKKEESKIWSILKKTAKDKRNWFFFIIKA